MSTVRSVAYYFNFVLLLFVIIACSRVKIDLSAPVTLAPIATVQPTKVPRFTATPWATFTPNPTPTATAPPIVINPPVLPCLLSNLNTDQHISANGSYTETQWSASGPMVCRIERNSCTYDLMVGNLEPSIVFKQEEVWPYNVEDVVMHPAMIQPLSHLNQLVQIEWKGSIQLRVTDAYDSLLEHDLNQTDPSRKYSLHFEGRAIDLTTWPVDRLLYDRLCALAHCAGFTWVHNEGSHCHASIKARSLCEGCGG